MLACFEAGTRAVEFEQIVHFALRDKQMRREWFNVPLSSALSAVLSASAATNFELIEIDDFRSLASSERPLTTKQETEIQRQIRDDPDDFELTPAQASKGKPFREALPALAASIDREIAKRGRPPLAVIKKPVTIRLNPETIAKFKATGKGWQSRVSDILDKAKV